MNIQPEALRLADELCAAPERSRTSFEAATELRRLPALRECVEDLEQAVTDYVLTYGEKHRPQSLVAMRDTVRKARAALAKASGPATQTGDKDTLKDYYDR